jgi:NAD(P) transhydrogenase subunit beta
VARFLSYIMCRAMNRKFLSVIAGGFGGGEGAAAEGREGRRAQAETFPIDATETAALLAGAKEVVIVPGYGMAVAQAQHVVRDISKFLRDKGVNVRFAIHPVAGRMPGHMNVLLAEAKVPYDIVFEMDEINEDFPDVDVSVVIGANDIVNPRRSTNPTARLPACPCLKSGKARPRSCSNAGWRPAMLASRILCSSGRTRACSSVTQKRASTPY